MKKVNFEPNERVDAPDANAIGDVAAEHVDKLGYGLAYSHTEGVDPTQRTNITAFDTGVTIAGAPSVLDHFTIQTFNADHTPYIINITSVPRCFFRSDYTKEIGAFGGQNVESPQLDLSQFSVLAEDESFYIFGRIKDIAGVKDNRARWRADVNPPREEVYLANTRRLPYFDARASQDMLSSSDGWFKIACVTRTASNNQSLLRFSFAHVYNAAFSAGTGVKTAFTSGADLIIASSVSVFGRGISQVIGGNQTLIAPATTTLALPLNLIDLTVYSLNNARNNERAAFKFLYDDGSATPLTKRSDVGSYAKAELSDKVFSGAAQSDIPTSNGSLTLLLNRMLTLIKSMHLGTPLVSGETTVSGVANAVQVARWNLPIFAHAELGNVSLRSLQDTISVGLHADAPCEEIIDPSAVGYLGTSAFYFMTRLLYRLKSDFTASLSHARTIRLTGFIRQPTRQLDARYFGGSNTNKGVSTLARYGGILVQGSSPEDLPTIQMLASVATNDETELAKEDGLHRNFMGCGAFLRKSAGDGACLAWTTSGRGHDSTDDAAYSLTIDSFNMTNLNPAFERSFLSQSADQTLFNFNPLTAHADTLEQCGGHGMMYVCAGGLTYLNSEFWMFNNPHSRENDQNTITLSHENELGSNSYTMPYAGEFIEIVVPPGSADTKPIIFKDCSFFRSDSAQYGTTNPLASMIRIRKASGEPINSARIIFENCSFQDFGLFNNTPAASSNIPFISTQKNSISSNLITFDAGTSSFVEFKSCLFSTNHSLDAAQYSDCVFSDVATVKHLSHGEEIELSLGRANISQLDLTATTKTDAINLLPHGIGLSDLGSTGAEHKLTKIESVGAQYSLDNSVLRYNEPHDNNSYLVHPLNIKEGFLVPRKTTNSGYTRYDYIASPLPLHVVKLGQQMESGSTNNHAVVQAKSFIRHIDSTADCGLLPILGSGIEIAEYDQWDSVAGGVSVVGAVKVHHGVRSRATARLLSDPNGVYNFAAPYRLPATTPNNKRPLDDQNPAITQFTVRKNHELRPEMGLVVENDQGMAPNYKTTRGVLRDPVYNGDPTNYNTFGQKVAINMIYSDTTFVESDERSYIAASTLYLGTPNDESLLPSGRHFFEAVSRRTANHMRLSQALVFDPAMTTNKANGLASGLSYYTQVSTGAGHSFAGNVQTHLNVADQGYNTHNDQSYDMHSTYTHHTLHTDILNNRSNRPVDCGLRGVFSNVATVDSFFKTNATEPSAGANGIIALDPFGLVRKDNEVAGIQGANSILGQMLRDAVGRGAPGGGKEATIRSPFMKATGGVPLNEPNLLMADLLDTLNFSNTQVRFKTAFNALDCMLFTTLPQFKLVQLSQLPIWLIHCTHYDKAGVPSSQGFVRLSYNQDELYDSNTGDRSNTLDLKIPYNDPNSIFSGGFCINVDLTTADFVGVTPTRLGIGFDFVTNVSLNGL